MDIGPELPLVDCGDVVLSRRSIATWQLVTSLAILVASLIGSIWLVARIFRAAMLMYGQALQPRQILQALREA